MNPPGAERREPMEDAPNDELVRLAELRRGHFALESGHHGDLWLDLDRLFVEPWVVAPLAR